MMATIPTSKPSAVDGIVDFWFLSWRREDTGSFLAVKCTMVLRLKNVINSGGK
jgi:hypothetical protein